MLPVRSENIKNDPTKEQSIDSNETPLFKNVLNLVGTPQSTNSTRMLPARNKGVKNDPTEKQSIDSGKTPLPGNILNLAGIP